MEGTIHIGTVDLVSPKYEVDVKRPDRFSIKYRDGFFMNLFTDLKYCDMERTIIVARYRTFDTFAHARCSRL